MSLADRARRVGLGLSQAQTAAALGVTPRDVREWERPGGAPPPELAEIIAGWIEWRDTTARRWVVAGETITIPADLQHVPEGVWWSAAGRALDVVDVDVVVQPQPGRARVSSIDPADLDHADEMRDHGLPWRDIAAEIGCDESTLRRHFGPDGQRTGPRRVIEIHDVEALHRAGLSQAGIAQQLGVSRMAVRRRLAEAGHIPWPTNPPKWTRQETP